MREGRETISIEERLANEFSGPIVFDYVWWILREAQARGIKRLYFLARDGYTLLRVARLMCEKFSISMDCRYLYCSRMALRTPTYQFIGEEACDLLLQWGYRVTLRSILLRGALTAEECDAVMHSLGMRYEDGEQPLTKAEFDELAVQLRRSTLFRRYVDEHSRSAYESAIGYLRQEGLFDQDFAIVDSGWTGSMQRSLRQLLESAGYGGRLCGFYFGMYDRPKDAADGEYLTWFFDAKERVRDKIIFNNNLFECILSAPHGMTAGYEVEGERYSPVMLSAPEKRQLDIINGQSDAIVSYAQKHIVAVEFSAFERKALHGRTAKLIGRYMLRPRREEALYYAGMVFCDDVAETYLLSLVSEEQVRKLRDYLLPRRALRRLKGRRAENSELFWPHGTIAFLPFWKRFLYQMNVLIWDWMKYMVQRVKNTGERGTT